MRVISLLFAFLTHIYIRNKVLLGCHDVEHELVGLAHSVGTDGGEVVNGLVDAVVDDAFGGGDALALHSEQG